MRDYRNTGKGWYVVPDSDTRFPRLDRDAAKAKRSVPVRAAKRVIVAGARTYAAYSAHQLLESESDASLARPGWPVG